MQNRLHLSANSLFGNLGSRRKFEERDSVFMSFTVDRFAHFYDQYNILPVRFVLHFRCEGSECKRHKMSILDWEISQLYRKVRNSRDWENKIKDKITKIRSSTKDTYLILGNMAKRQHIFCILGFFYPPRSRQLPLF